MRMSISSVVRMSPASRKIGATMTRRPRVAMVMHSVFNAKFFLVPHLHMLAEEYEVLLYLRNDAPEILATMDLPVRIIEIPIERRIAPLADLKALIALVFAFRRDRPDLVHSMTAKGGLLGMLAAYIACVPQRVHTFQGEVWANYTGPKRTIFRSLDWLVARLATDVTIVSASGRDYLRAEGVLESDQGRVLGSGSICGVDLTRFYPRPGLRTKMRSSLGLSPDDFAILYLGRLQRDKGLHVLQDAFFQLRTRCGRAVKLLVVGPDEDGLGAGLKEVLGQDVIIHPYTERPEDFIAASDLLVLPSFREGFGMVLIEAAAMGVPSVASRIYGISNAVIDGDTGILFDVGRADALADAMEKLIQDENLRHSMCEKGISRVVAEFDQQKVLEHFRVYYRNRIKNKEL